MGIWEGVGGLWVSRGVAGYLCYPIRVGNPHQGVSLWDVSMHLGHMHQHFVPQSVFFSVLERDLE